ncbi:MAG: pyridoxal-phosphate dependent enzyme [Pseudomonadota bacterium]
MISLEFPTPKLPIQPIRAEWLSKREVQLSVLRADLADPLLSGNKFFKLKYNLQDAAQQGHTHLLSFGGAWSNHLHALAAAGQRFDFATTGIIRGDAGATSNACLDDLVAMGMQLRFVSRAEYQQKHTAEFLAQLRQELGDFYLIPEGGANLAGIRGCQELLPLNIEADFTHVVLACGTGTTLAGILTSSTVPVIGIQVLKGVDYLRKEVINILNHHGLSATAPWSVLDDFHGGGYAKVSDELLSFMQKFTAATDVPLEPVYSGKMFMALSKLIPEGYFPTNSRILAIHGGGLQGLRGFL